MSLGVSLRAILCSGTAIAAVAGAYSPSKNNVEWLSDTPFDGKQYSDGMPTGNGDVAVLAWGNRTAGGLSFFIRSARAQHTDSALFTIAKVQVELSPNPFATGSYWNQTLHLDSSAITIHGGGSTFADYAASLSILVDADANSVVVMASSRDGKEAYNLTVRVDSVRPPKRLSYKAPFVCNESSTGPDVILSDLQAKALPRDTVGLYHVNDIAAGDTAFFADTFRQQGLQALLDRFEDPLDGRIFGVGLSGAAAASAAGGDGAVLVRRGPSWLASATPAPAFVVVATVVVRPDAKGDAAGWLAALSKAMATDPDPVAQTARTVAWWRDFWARSYIEVPDEVDGVAAPISQIYALTRFVQAVQSRTEVPIKFNGMLFMNQAGSNGPLDVDYRQWGAGNWWQNTRLPYGNMLKAGDFDTMRSVLDWATSFLPLALARTEALLPGERGAFFTECVTAFGLYQQEDYGCTRTEGYPTWLSATGWLHYDFGGNGVGMEGGLMALDYFLHTGDLEAAKRYVPLATNVVDFYLSHYKNRTADGKVIIWPTQVLETYWCEWPGWNDCCQDDLPQVAALHSLLGRLLQLPKDTGLLTPSQRKVYSDALGQLPPLPLQANGTQFAPAAVWSRTAHNSEVPELYGVHPFRLFTVGRATVDPTVKSDIQIGINTFRALPLAKENTGWYYGVMDAALLGLAEDAWRFLQDRATQAPATGYRFPAFAQHYQDYPPSADHFANHNTALQLMLLQTGEDEAEAGSGTLVLFPAWPCHLDVSFKLWGPWRTTIEVVYKSGQLQHLEVEPSARAKDVRWANCVSRADAAAALASARSYVI